MKLFNIVSCLVLSLVLSVSSVLAAYYNVAPQSITTTVGSKVVLTPAVGSTVLNGSPSWAIPMPPGTNPQNPGTAGYFYGKVMTIASVTQAAQGSYTVSWFDKKGNQYGQVIYLKVTSNASVPLVTSIGTITTASPVSSLTLPITGTQQACIVITVRGKSVLKTGIATPKVQLLDVNNKVIAEGYVFSGKIYDTMYFNFFTFAYGKLIPFSVGETELVANVSPGTYTVKVSGLNGAVGDFRLDVNDYNY
jgi:hypothetical protein